MRTSASAVGPSSYLTSVRGPRPQVRCAAPWLPPAAAGWCGRASTARGRRRRAEVSCLARPAGSADTERRGQLDDGVEQPATNAAGDVGGGAVELGLGDRRSAEAQPRKGRAGRRSCRARRRWRAVAPSGPLMTLDLGRQARSPCFVPGLEVGADQSVLAPKGVVEAGLRDAGALDDRVDADGVHASPVEELAGGGQQPVSG